MEELKEKMNIGKKPVALTVLDWVCMLLLAAALYLVLVYAPTEAVMGDVQRLFYFHAAAGWVGMLCFISAAVAAVLYLRGQQRKWDIVQVAGIEIGLLFSFINVATGSIWARPVWNTWWTWDVRLVTAAITLLLFSANLILRQGIDDPGRRARFSAVYTIIGFFSVPLSFLSIRLWRTIHQVVVGGGDAGGEGVFAMSGEMRITFYFSLFTFTVMAVDLMWHRIRLGRLAERVDEMKMDMDRQ